MNGLYDYLLSALVTDKGKTMEITSIITVKHKIRKEDIPEVEKYIQQLGTYDKAVLLSFSLFEK